MAQGALGMLGVEWMGAEREARHLTVDLLISF